MPIIKKLCALIFCFILITPIFSLPVFAETALAAETAEESVNADNPREGLGFWGITLSPLGVFTAAAAIAFSLWSQIYLYRRKRRENH